MQLLPILTFLCICLIKASDVSYPPPQSYHYNSTVLYDVTSDAISYSYLIQPGWQFNYGGRVYNQCLFYTTSGSLYFETISTGQESYFSQVSVSSRYLTGTRLLITTTADNFTIDYTAFDETAFNYQNSSLTARWKITYYRSTTSWTFDVDTCQNGIIGDTGTVGMPEGSKQIDVVTVRLVRYTNLFKSYRSQVFIGLSGALIAIIAVGVCFRRTGKRYSHWLCCCRKGSAASQQVYSERSNQQIRSESADTKSSGYFRMVDREEICPVCLERGVEVEGKCQHRLHLECLRKWYERSPGCPYCHETSATHLLKCIECDKFSLKAFGPSSLPARLGTCCEK